MRGKAVAVWVGLTLALYAIHLAHPAILSVFWTGRWVDGPALQKTLNVMVTLSALSHALAGSLIGHWYGQKWLGVIGTALITVLSAYLFVIIGTSVAGILAGPLYEAYLSADAWLFNLPVWALVSVIIASVVGRRSARSHVEQTMPAHADCDEA